MDFQIFTHFVACDGLLHIKQTAVWKIKKTVFMCICMRVYMCLFVQVCLHTCKVVNNSLHVDKVIHRGIKGQGNSGTTGTRKILIHEQYIIQTGKFKTSIYFILFYCLHKYLCTCWAQDTGLKRGDKCDHPPNINTLK